MEAEADQSDEQAWHELMLLRGRFRSRVSSTPTDLEGCSIGPSTQALSTASTHSLDTEQEDSQDTLTNGDNDSWDSGLTSFDCESRKTAPRDRRSDSNPRKILIENLLHEIYGNGQSDSFNEDFEETQNLVRRRLSSNASQISKASQSSQFLDYTIWRLDVHSDISKTKQSLGFQGSMHVDKEVLEILSVKKLRKLVASYERTCMAVNRYMVAKLKKKDKRQIVQSKQCLIISAALQSKNEEKKIRFSITSPPGDGYRDWLEGMRAVLRLPGGLPSAFRKTMWTTIANQYISQLPIEWEKVKLMVLHDRLSQDESEMGIQIVKDLHRTGVSDYCGDHNDRERHLLKRVLLAYARFRPSVGYCQGFNIIAAVILDVVDKNEEEALKIMIYLIEHVLPPNYFAHDLEALSVDLAVFQELTHEQMPELSNHLDMLRTQSLEERGANGGDEPPLTNLFTIQWFLTLFATCLPQEATLRIWDMLFLYGSTILMKTALALLKKLEKYFLPMESAFDFYSIMSELQLRMLDSALFGPEEVAQAVLSVPDFDLRMLRLKHTFQPPQNLRSATNGMCYSRALRTTKSHDDRAETHGLFSNFIEKRRASVLVHKERMARRSSLAEAETDINGLRKKFADYTKDHQNARASVNDTAQMMERLARRRGSIFTTESTDTSPDKELPQANPFQFPPKDPEEPSNPSVFPRLRADSPLRVTTEKDPNSPVRISSPGTNRRLSFHPLYNRITSS
ncbi:hypothetical protein RvY_05104 [Ramazzottius varieornatus]|uniref:Rab-GAP TBC domain-containing protein n=1 Tax=Ramazzottius varieornatus TaxID=947166 RepID=A0A1D1V0L3_RAMVA|nr:hypothetical protein RvY_05104 [Ramazzottius varieornatus]